NGEPLRLGTGTLGVTAAGIGLGLRWTAGGGLTGNVSADRARLVLPDGDVPLPELTFGPDGRLALDAAGWTAVEQLLGRAADAAAAGPGRTWLATLVQLLGWSGRGSVAGVAAAAAGSRLPLADLVTDPGAALATLGQSVVDAAGQPAALAD